MYGLRPPSCLLELRFGGISRREAGEPWQGGLPTWRVGLGLDTVGWVQRSIEMSGWSMLKQCPLYLVDIPKRMTCWQKCFPLESHWNAAALGCSKLKSIWLYNMNTWLNIVLQRNHRLPGTFCKIDQDTDSSQQMVSNHMKRWSVLLTTINAN